MRRCIVGRNSICARDFSVSSRRFSKIEAGLGTRSTLSKDQLANLKLLPASIAKEKVENSSQAPENDSPVTRPLSVRRPLPLSPLMDPEYIIVKNKHHLPKPKPPPLEQRTPFQLELENNIYAQALATPVRRCQVTEFSLPRFFLQDFEIIAHPETKQPWLMPRSLAAANTDPPEQRTRGTSVGTRSYAISRAMLFHDIGKRGSGLRKADDSLFTSRMQKNPRFVNAHTLQKRKSLGPVLLELMRRRLVEALVLASESCVACEGYEDVKSMKQVGAVLWFGRFEGDVSPGADVEEVAASLVTPEGFSTLDLDRERGIKVPVHNLQRILGRKHIQNLRKLSPRFDAKEMLVLNHSEATIEVQLKLWKSQGHVLGLADKDLEASESVDIATIEQ